MARMRDELAAGPDRHLSILEGTFGPIVLLSSTDIHIQRPDVVTALHASHKETAWVECDNIVSSQLYLRNSPAAIHLLPGILESSVRVLMFAGDEDLICNYKGIERMIDRMEWSGGQGLSVSLTKCRTELG